MTRRKLIHIDEAAPGTLKCDAVGCSYRDAEPLPFTEDLIGRPCPVCGANMLTRADFEDAQKLLTAIGTVNRAFGHLGTENSDADHTAVRFGVHEGEFTIDLAQPGARP